MLLFLFLAPLIAADGTNIGNVYDRCTGQAALSAIWSGSAEELAERSMRSCRHLEPKLREGFERSWRTNRDGTVDPPTNVSRSLASHGWDGLLKAKKDRLIRDIGKARIELGKKKNAQD